MQLLLKDFCTFWWEKLLTLNKEQSVFIFLYNYLVGFTLKDVLKHLRLFHYPSMQTVLLAKAAGECYYLHLDRLTIQSEKNTKKVGKKPLCVKRCAYTHKLTYQCCCLSALL